MALFDPSDEVLPPQVQVALQTIVTQLQAIADQIVDLEAEVLA